MIVARSTFEMLQASLKGKPLWNAAEGSVLRIRKSIAGRDDAPSLQGNLTTTGVGKAGKHLSCCKFG